MSFIPSSYNNGKISVKIFFHSSALLILDMNVFHYTLSTPSQNCNQSKEKISGTLQYFEEKLI